MKEHLINSDPTTFVRGYYATDSEQLDILNEVDKWFLDIVKEVRAGKDVGNVASIIKNHSKHSIDADFAVNMDLYQAYSDKVLQPALDSYVETYPVLNKHARFSQKDFANVQLYEQDSLAYYSWHSERMGSPDLSAARMITFMTYLNTIDGSTEFMYQKLSIEPEKGLTLLFPSDFTHTHKGNASKTGEKRFITGWFSYSEIHDDLQNFYTGVQQ